VKKSQKGIKSNHPTTMRDRQEGIEEDILRQKKGKLTQKKREICPCGTKKAKDEAANDDLKKKKKACGGFLGRKKTAGQLL